MPYNVASDIGLHCLSPIKRTQGLYGLRTLPGRMFLNLLLVIFSGSNAALHSSLSMTGDSN